MHINDKNQLKLKLPITGIVCGNIGNTTKYVAISYTRSNFPVTKVHKNVKISSLSQWVTNGHLTWESSDPQRDDLSVKWSACARDNTLRKHIHLYIQYMCNTIIWTMQSFIFLPNHDVHMCSLHTPLSFLFPKKFPALVFSAWGCVFFFVCRNSCLHSPFSPNRGKENKNIMKGLKEITGCQGSETQSVYVCAVCVFLQRGKNTCMHVWVCLLTCMCTGVVCAYT